MKIIITIQHPADVHFFRNAISELSKRDHTIRVYCRDKDISTTLLENFGISYEVLAGHGSTPLGLLKTQAIYEYRLLRKAIDFSPDLIMAGAEPSVAHVSRLVGARSVLFADTEHATLQNILSFPFSHLVCIPDCYSGRILSRSYKYPSYHELAYLHPDRFEPDTSVLEMAGLEKDERFALVRSVAWQAAHDIGKSGYRDMIDLVQELENNGVTVIYSAEGEVPEELQSNLFSPPPEMIHDLMAYADLFIGESSTMASECAVLGTPSIYLNPLELGYISELDQEYGLVKNIPENSSVEELVSLANSILQEDPKIWKDKRQNLLSDKVDATEIILDIVGDIRQDLSRV